LLQYVSTGTYYGRIKVSGKVIRQSLKTKVFTIAKLNLADFVKENLSQSGSTGNVPTFADAMKLFVAELQTDPGYKPKTKAYKAFNISQKTK
jgi:hypothetical protein